MKRLLTIALMVVFAGLTITAQTTTTKQTKKTKANVTGYVKDSEDAEALVRATIQIMSEDTTRMISGGVTNTLGGYTIKNVEEGTYIVKISYLGYHNWTKKITIKNAETIHNVGTVMLIPNTIVIEGAVVTGALPQMEVKEDTIIFNAEAFKVPEGAVLEDLVKKLPGAEVDNDGTIKINGKTISRILVNGKEFFSNDKDMAMKNIPTEIIDKIKTYDKASDQERLTGIADGNEETVIDLTVKKGMNKGWFGNLDLGAGSHDQYSNRVNLNHFIDDNFQASFIGNLNSNGGGGMGAGRGGGGGGKSLSGSGGLNLVVSKERKYEIGGNIRYNASKRETESRSSSENYVTTKKTFSDRIGSNMNHSDQANAEFKVELQLDSFTTLLVRPVIGINNSSSTSDNRNATYNADPYLIDGIENPMRQWADVETGMLIPGEIDQFGNPSTNIVNRSLSNSRSFSDGKNASVNATLSHRYRTRNKNLSFNFSANINDNDSKNFNASNNIYYQQNMRAQPIYRFRTSPNKSNSITAGFSYSQPLATNLALQTTYSFNHSYRKNTSDTYNFNDNTQHAAIDGQLTHPDIMGLRDELLDKLGYVPEDYLAWVDSALSNHNVNVDNNHNLNVQIRWNNNFITSSLGAQIQPQSQHIEMVYMHKDIDTTRNFFRISPTVQFRYRFNRQNQLNFSYRGNMNQPSLTDMIDMVDDSNPMNIRHGNPGLKNSFQNSFQLGWNNYITATMQNYTVNLSFSNTMNSISNRTKYDEITGVRETQPENINGNWNMNGSFGFNTPLFANERLMLNTSTNASYNNNVSYLMRQMTDANNNLIPGQFEDLKNQTNNLSLGENVSLTYRANNWDVRVNGRFNYRHQDNKYVKVTSPDTYDFSYGFESNGNFDNGWGYATNFSVSNRRGYASKEANKTEYVWNAQVSYRFLKGRRATISLQAYDILNQRSNFNRNVSANSRTDTWTQTINSYVMAHFIYRFNFFGSASGRRELRQERRERQAARDEMERATAAPAAAPAQAQRPAGMGAGGRF